MNTNQNDVGRGFWFAWVLASAIGFGVGATLALLTALYAQINSPTAFAISFGIVLGVVGGLAQWLVLRRWFTRINL
ncbi:MAG TPA: hypothetical protein VMN99_01215 [Anaerolineales bacterium]|nr:hypothetical protein [Anaerolineales bacterium]